MKNDHADYHNRALYADLPQAGRQRFVELHCKRAEDRQAEANYNHATDLRHGAALRALKGET